MGYIDISTGGSFEPVHRRFGAMKRGHAHAVAEAIAFLAEEVLPRAIEQDHRLQAEGATPSEGFDRRPR